MDVDCDGADDKAGDCSNDPSGFGETSFMDTVKGYGISDLNANIHPYIVVNEPPYFDAQKNGMKPLSVMAVVCNNQVVSPSGVSACPSFYTFTTVYFTSPYREIPFYLTVLAQWYGVWGDTNQEPTTGEASIALAKLCFPNEHLTGDNGHGAKDVMYIGFTGDKAVPGKAGANWKAKNTQDFEASIKALGDKLVAGLGK